MTEPDRRMMGHSQWREYLISRADRTVWLVLEYDREGDDVESVWADQASAEAEAARLASVPLEVGDLHYDYRVVEHAVQLKQQTQETA